jgi:hypothetical protein
VLGLLVIGGLVGGGYWFGPWHRTAARPVARVSTGARPSSPARVAAAKAGAPSVTAPAALTPEQSFPAAVGDYVKVRQLALPNCTENPAVQPTLAGLVVQGHGCLGMSFALYADSAKNEYTVAVLSLKDPADAPSIVTTLSANPTDVQIGTVLPPASAGLRTLGSDDGAVQQFASEGPYVTIGVAAWSDGHRGDYQKLEERLTPIFQAVAKQVGTHVAG